MDLGDLFFNNLSFPSQVFEELNTSYIFVKWSGKGQRGLEWTVYSIRTQLLKHIIAKAVGIHYPGSRHTQYRQGGIHYTGSRHTLHRQ